MATPAENLQTAYESLTAAYAAACADPKPSYSDGTRSVSHTEYLAGLSARIAEIGKLITQASPVEIVTQVRPR